MTAISNKSITTTKKLDNRSQKNRVSKQYNNNGVGKIEKNKILLTTTAIATTLTKNNFPTNFGNKFSLVYTWCNTLTHTYTTMHKYTSHTYT